MKSLALGAENLKGKPGWCTGEVVGLFKMARSLCAPGWRSKVSNVYNLYRKTHKQHAVIVKIFARIAISGSQPSDRCCNRHGGVGLTSAVAGAERAVLDAGE